VSLSLSFSLSALIKKDKAPSWLQQRICGWFREVAVNGGCSGAVEPGFAYAVDILAGEVSKICK
jgi:hypothetical protein